MVRMIHFGHRFNSDHLHTTNIAIKMAMFVFVPLPSARVWNIVFVDFLLQNKALKMKYKTLRYRSGAG